MTSLRRSVGTVGLVLTLAAAGQVALTAGAHAETATVTSSPTNTLVGARTSVWKNSGTSSLRRSRTTTTAAARKTKPAPVASPTATSSPTPAPTAPTTTSPTPTTAPDVLDLGFTRTSGRPFAVTSAWNTAVPAGPVLDPNSSAMVSYLASGANPGVADLYAYGVPIWDADASTPRYTVDCVKPWGTCGLETTAVPVPDEAFATSVTDDGAMVVVDWSTRKAYEFYEGQKTASGGWQAGWGGVVDIDGSGTGAAATGSNVSRLAGVVRAREIAAGRIDHALVFSTNNACTGTYRYPATKTDGRATRTDCIPEGARIVLDPSIDVDAIAGITPGERTVAKALQTYGAYAIDNGGANMAFIFEVPSGEADPYKAAGLTGDYFGMNRIPWSRLSVTRQWDGR